MGKGEVAFPEPSPDGIPNNKTGTFATATGHIICAVVGAGVLALPQSVAWLGWIAGPILITVFYLISLMSSRMLTECYETEGIEHARYHHAVRHILNERSAFFVSLFQLLNIFLTTIAYTITGASSMQMIAQFACTNDNPDDCLFSKANGGIWQLTLVFGGAELLLSQVKNLEEAWWVSALGTVGSIVYALIAFVIAVVNAVNGGVKGTIGGIAAGEEIYGGTVATTAGKIFGILNSLGAIGFAYNFMLILLEIQDTLKQPPRAATTMKKACNIAITASFCFYLAVAVAGYAAEGNQVAGMILESFDGPKVALIIANIAVLLHMLTAYQVYGQAVFNTIESHIKWWQIRKAAKAGHAKTAAAATATPATAAGTDKAEKGMPTPFDAPAEAGTDAHAHKPHIHEHKNLLGMHHVKLEPLAERLSTALSNQITDPRLSSLLEQLHSADNLQIETKKSTIARARSSMYAVDTGFANEEVPLNEEHFYLPLGYRIVIRSAYVLFITLMACIMPFFGAFAGLVGAVTFFPLAIYFPYACYRKVRPVSPQFSALLWILWWCLLFVACTATIGSVRTIIVSWSTFTLFGT